MDSDVVLGLLAAQLVRRLMPVLRDSGEFLHSLFLSGVAVLLSQEVRVLEVLVLLLSHCSIGEVRSHLVRQWYVPPYNLEFGLRVDFGQLFRGDIRVDRLLNRRKHLLLLHQGSLLSCLAVSVNLLYLPQLLIRGDVFYSGQVSGGTSINHGFPLSSTQNSHFFQLTYIEPPWTSILQSRVLNVLYLGRRLPVKPGRGNGGRWQLVGTGD